MTDEKIVQLIRQGHSNKALGELYKHLDAFIMYSYKYYRISAKEEAIEAFHAALPIFIAQVERKKSIVLTSTIKTYIFAIAKNILRNEQRRLRMVLGEQSREHVRLLDASEEEEDEEGVEKNIEEKNKRMKALEEALIEIGAEQAKIIKLYYLKGKTVPQITKLLGYKNDRVVSNLKTRALKKLKEQIFKSLYVLILLAA
ncbi:MAG: sigma-70 family RNA polymerase sigma factor [Bernardetiaceae bacterium]|nr:sigma-70 family RNA polymerase sigma factor [Bernardetiaceae bacterium]